MKSYVIHLSPRRAAGPILRSRPFLNSGGLGHARATRTDTQCRESPDAPHQDRPRPTWPRTLRGVFVVGMSLIYLAPDELTPAAESALVHRLLEDGDNPNAWTVSYVWVSDGVFAVVLEGDEGVRAFTVIPEGEGYEVMEVSYGPALPPPLLALC